MNNKIKAAVVAAMLAAGVLVPTTPASAAGAACGWPYVCVYKGSMAKAPTARFRQVTSGWQYLNRSRGAKGFYNTRRNDVAYFKLANGRTICLPPRTSGGSWDVGAVAVRISYEKRCR